MRTVASAHIKTRTIRVDPQCPEPMFIAEAAQTIRAGGLVAFPTETVYGLGASAFDIKAVGRIFRAKGRPPENPLIVHVGSIELAKALVRYWPREADILTAQFWPGPLTLVFEKLPIVADLITAGGPTIALRLPAHPVARALLDAADVPIAAPSANRSGGVSATDEPHVRRALRGRIELILDAGRTAGGIESTVLDLTTSPPRVLRPGLVTPAMLRAAIGEVAVKRARTDSTEEPERSPGRIGRHYAPRAQLICVDGDGRAQAEAIAQTHKQVALLSLGAREPLVSRSELPRNECGDYYLSPVYWAMPAEPRGYAAALYLSLHELDMLKMDVLVVELPPDTEEWLAVRDRLLRASLTLRAATENGDEPELSEDADER
jgi:L-threonylcarbamoyladenylate synthase